MYQSLPTAVELLTMGVELAFAHVTFEISDVPTVVTLICVTLQLPLVTMSNSST